MFEIDTIIFPLPCNQRDPINIVSNPKPKVISCKDESLFLELMSIMYEYIGPPNSLRYKKMQYK